MRYLVILMLLLTPVVSLGAYSPPVGIPDPATEWGGVQDPIDDLPPSPPNPWVSPVAGYYYVNAATGTDSNRPYGTPSAPRQSIPNPIPAGSYVEVHGTYNYATGGAIRVNGAGTSAQWSAGAAGPAWVVGVDGDLPYFTGGKTILYGSYLYFHNVLVGGVTNDSQLQISSGSTGFAANHIVIRKVDIRGTPTGGAGIMMTSNSASPVDHVLVYNSTVHDCGPAYDIDQDSHIIAGPNSFYNKTWILGNTLYNASGSGIQVSAGAPAATFVYIGGNTVFNSRQSGIWVKYGTDVIVSSNVVHDIQDRCVGADTSPSKGLGAQYAPTRVWWINNNVFNVRYGIRVASTNGDAGEYYAIGNIIHDVKDMGGTCFGPPGGSSPWDPAAIHYHGGTVKWALNNTIYSVLSGLHDSSTATGAVFTNNILSGITHPNGYALFTETASRTEANYNLYFNAAGSIIRWGSGGTRYATLASFQSATGREANGRQGDPLFANAAQDDLRITAASPAVDGGSATALFQTFRNLYGLDIATDIAGTRRPQGAAWDMGAYEFGSGGSWRTPNAPTALQVH